MNEYAVTERKINGLWWARNVAPLPTPRRFSRVGSIGAILSGEDSPDESFAAMDAEDKQ